MANYSKAEDVSILTARSPRTVADIPPAALLDLLAEERAAAELYARNLTLWHYWRSRGYNDPKPRKPAILEAVEPSIRSMHSDRFSF